MMKRLLIILLILGFAVQALAIESKEVLELKLQALTWEFKSHQAEVQLRQFRMQSIKAEAAKIKAALKELGKKDKKDALEKKE